MVIDVPVIPVLNPLFVGGYHLIVYAPTLSEGNLNVIEEVVDTILVGRLAFPGTVLKQY